MFDAEAAKREYVAYLEEEWRNQWRNANFQRLHFLCAGDVPRSQIPNPPPLAPKNWIVHRFATGSGGFVADFDAFCKLTKARQTKLLKS